MGITEDKTMARLTVFAYPFLAIAVALAGSVALAATPADNMRQSICLNGDLWQIVAGDKLPAEPPGQPTGLPWRPTRVPGCFRETLGHEFAETQPDPKLLGSGGAYQANLPWHRGEAWYRLVFYVPADWNDGRKVALAFEGVNYRCRVLVNGKPVGEHEGAHAAFEVNCGEALRFGETNTLHVWVKAIRPFDFYGDRESRFAGIWGDVYLRSYPAVFVEGVQVLTSVRQKTLTMRLSARNTTTQPQRVTLRTGVWLGAERALPLPDRELDIGADKAEVVEIVQPWRSPQLWGFAPYGAPVLYTLRATLTGESLSSDTVTTRFGFREFWTEGNKFLFNGKPFFLKGDLISAQGLLTDNRQSITQYCLAERGANINFIRLHYDGFPAGIADWLDVADELGMLIEPEQHLRRGIRHGQSLVETDAEAQHRVEVLKAEWEAFARRHGNHPSVVMVSIDNEAVSQGDWGQPPAPDKPHPVWCTLNEIQQCVHGIKPDWLVEAQGDVWLGVAAKQGYFKPLQVFNVHPYGNPLGKPMKELCDKYQCPPDVPIHVGEIWHGLREPFNWWTRPAEMLRKRTAIWFNQNRCGAYYAQSILSVKEHGAAGASLCSGEPMYFGFGKDPTDVRFGAWQAECLALDEDFSDPKANGGRGQGVNLPAVQIPYPSLAGAGLKVRWLVPINPNDYGNQFNWFDPTRPAFTTNCIYEHVKRAFKDVDGQDAGGLAEHRAPEMVVAVSAKGEPLAGVYVRLSPLEGQPANPQAVMTDSAGTAWFVLAHSGSYRLDVFGGPSLPRVDDKVIRVAEPLLRSGGGYSHIQYEALGDAGPIVQRLRATLEKPAPVTVLARTERPHNHAAEDEEFEQAFRKGHATLFCRRPDFEDVDYSGVLPEWVKSVGINPMKFVQADAWAVPESEKENVGRISFDLAREKVKGNIRLLIDAEDTGNVFIRLRGPRWEDVAWDSAPGGSIFSGMGQRVRKEVLVPLAKFPGAWVVELRRQSGAVKIYRIRAEMDAE
jgi:hypothetical protein